MKYTLCSLALLTGAIALMPATALAADAQINVDCNFSHMKPDDAILMPNMPGMAMSHDFVGNRSSDAFSTADSLLLHSGTTCDNAADSTAYWVPTMQLPDGTIVNPTYIKNYYQANNVLEYPITPYPHGLQLLGGDHRGTGPNPHVSFLCANGNGYTNTANQICGLRAAGDAVQFNIGVMFPDCWDGKNLKAKGTNNAVYSNNSGQCPADHPVKLAKVNMNIAYVLPQIKSLDVSKIKLSLDPKIIDGNLTPLWGSIYTAHGDFMNAWTDDATKFMADRCMNYKMDCGTNIPYSYSDVEADTYVSNQTDSDTNFGTVPTLLVQDNWNSPGRDQNKQILALMKFKIPALPTNIDDYPGVSFKYKIRVFDGNTTDKAAVSIFFYPTDAGSWDENTVTWNNKPAFKYTADGSIYMDNVQQFRYVDVDKAVRAALAAGKTEVAYYIGGERNGRTITVNSRESGKTPTLMLIGYQKVVEP
ncbi:CBM96 family carbohydrate-binding protein [Rahnella sp. PCH160]|uniref:CBM96 family carbohydrate-binding protein n=1 Tax=Rahnella sp. PCH160 TaxID=3447928 RepID=UPI0039FCF65F